MAQLLSTKKGKYFGKDPKLQIIGNLFLLIDSRITLENTLTVRSEESNILFKFL